jgi:hypothetical protein
VDGGGAHAPSTPLPGLGSRSGVTSQPPPPHALPPARPRSRRSLRASAGSSTRTLKAARWCPSSHPRGRAAACPARRPMFTIPTAASLAPHAAPLDLGNGGGMAAGHAALAAGLAPAYAQPMGLYAIQQGMSAFALDAWGNPGPAAAMSHAPDACAAFAASPAQYAAAAASQAALAAAAAGAPGGYLLSPQQSAAAAAAAAMAAAAAGSPTSSASLQVRGRAHAWECTACRAPTEGQAASVVGYGGGRTHGCMAGGEWGPMLGPGIYSDGSRPQVQSTARQLHLSGRPPLLHAAHPLLSHLPRRLTTPPRPPRAAPTRSPTGRRPHDLHKRLPARRA